MSKSKKEKSKKRKSKALKLPIAGETVLGRIINPTTVGDQGQLHIDRMYAQGGFVVVQMLNYKTNKMEKRMMTPEEAAVRMANLNRNTPKEYMPKNLSGAVVKACMAAKRQTLDGENEFFKANQADDVEGITAQIYNEIEEARKNDAELAEEMDRVEAKAGNN